MGLGPNTARRTQDSHTAEALMATDAMMQGTTNETFAHLMMTEQLSMLSVEEREFVETHHQILSCGRQAGRAVIELCRKLKIMRDGKSYKAAAFGTFDEYVEEALGLKRSQAYKYVRIAESFPDTFLEENAGLGVSKLYALAAMTETEIEEIREKVDLKNAGKAEVEEAVKAALRERDEAQKQLGILNEEMDSLRTELDEREKSHEGLQKAYTAKKNEVLEIKAREKALQEEVKRLGGELKAAKETVKTVPDEESKKAAEAAEARADALDRELKETREKLEAMQTQNPTTPDELVLFKANLAALRRIGTETLVLLLKLDEKCAPGCKKSVKDLLAQWEASLA